jgi:starch synthase
LNVLFASAEVAPFAKAGGLGDVVGSLPKALRAEGVDARVLMPLYGSIDTNRYQIKPLFNFKMSRRNGTAEISISYTVFDTVPIYFLSSWPFFGDGNYLYTNWDWDMPRFIFFSQAIQAVAWQLAQGAGGHNHWVPDVLHFNDWHTGLGAFLLDTSRGDPLWGRMGSVQTIHNMAYQGPHAGGWLFDVGVPGRNHPDLVYQDKTDNLMAISLAYADVVSTVSPRYAVEMQYPRFGEGLDTLMQMRARSGDVIGILNGIDPELWNPATDKSLPHQFDIHTFLAGRAANKAQMQIDAGLPVNPNVPLIGMVSRLTDQKGIDLAIPALRQLLSDTECQLIVLGTGEPALERQLWRLAEDFGWKARAYLQYNALISQRIYGASDLFLMPSRYEPCGTSQMIAMRYGSLPIVRETGGLADTVANYDNGSADYGTGFVFTWEEASAVLNTLRWAINTYHNRPDAFQRMQRRAMQVDFSWKKSAGEYVSMYERTLTKHR